MPIRVVTGLDWSGDAGSVEKAVRESPYLIVGACHAHIDDRAELAQRLMELKRKLRVSNDHAFKYSRSAFRVREEFLRVMIASPVHFTVHTTDKRTWRQQEIGASTGSERIRRAIASLIDECSDDLVCGQRLLVDANRHDARFIQALREAIRQGQKLMGRSGFAKISPLPDDRSDGMLIQAADMIAGYAGKLLMSEQSMDIHIRSKIRFTGDIVAK